MNLQLCVYTYDLLYHIIPKQQLLFNYQNMLVPGIYMETYDL